MNDEETMMKQINIYEKISDLQKEVDDFHSTLYMHLYNKGIEYVTSKSSRQLLKNLKDFAFMLGEYRKEFKLTNKLTKQDIQYFLSRLGELDISKYEKK